MYVINLAEMAHEAGGADGSPQHTPSPPHAPRLPAADSTFHHQIMQNQSPRKNHIAERAKQTLENSFLMQLKKQQQIQQEILLQHFQQQRQQLAQEHEQQLRHHLKLWEQKKAMEEAALREAREALEAREARERHERDRVELLRKKDKHEHSANASTQVKQKLQEFLKKKQANANGTVPSPSFSVRNWGIVKSSSGESITSPGVAGAHPYRLAAPLPLVLNAAPAQPSPHDYPLRKTASEPNMLKVRLKARVIERRASPLARRPVKRPKHRNCDGVSPRGSPPGGAAAPIREEEEAPRAPELLFSSPSMPNISLGRPHAPPRPAPAPAALPPVCEAEPYGAPARGAKRPLGRTHSAPLPLGDPALQPQAAHHYLRDQIRKTVLTRAHDAAAAQLREEEGEVIDLTARGAGAGAARAGEPAPLARALSSPLVGARVPATGLAYDGVMLKHGCGCGAHAPTHPEHGGRLQSVWARLCETGLAARTERTRPRKASPEELAAVHGEAHVALFAGRREPPRPVRHLVRLACGGLGVDSDTAWSDAHTAPAARAAAGAVLDLALRTARGELRNGFAVVRPPGHHAEPNQAMGFCFFNNVAIAARLLHTRLHLQRILIVDWDVHHGNGTQQIFYEDPHVLYMSIHRHDDGNFFPGTGAATECGAGAGLGFNVNVAWGGGADPPLGDAEYLAAFRSIIMPIAKVCTHPTQRHSRLQRQRGLGRRRRSAPGRRRVPGRLPLHHHAHSQGVQPGDSAGVVRVRRGGRAPRAAGRLHRVGRLLRAHDARPHAARQREGGAVAGGRLRPAGDVRLRAGVRARAAGRRVRRARAGRAGAPPRAARRGRAAPRHPGAGAALARDQAVQLAGGHVCAGGGAGRGGGAPGPPADGAPGRRHGRRHGHAVHAPRHLPAVRGELALGVGGAHGAGRRQVSAPPRPADIPARAAPAPRPRRARPAPAPRPPTTCLICILHENYHFYNS